MPFALPNILTRFQPTCLVFGVGCATECVDEILRIGGRRLFLICSPSVRQLAEPLLLGLEASGLTVAIFDAVPPEPAISHLTDARDAASSFNPDTVIGFGGGSVLDIAKLVAALGNTHSDVRDVFGAGLLKGRPRRLVCLPTTSGTGSEVSPNAILIDEETGTKRAVISPWLVPDAAFVDPSLTISMPAALTAATGIDALTHCIEAFANLRAHPSMDLIALEGAELIFSHLASAVRSGSDSDARSAVSLGSLYGGLCLGPVNTAAVHALAYPLGTQFHLGHGLSNALLLPHVLRFNLAAAPERYATLAVRLGISPGPDPAATATAGIERIADLCRDCGIPTNLEAVGIGPDDIPALAAEAMGVTRLISNNLRPVSVSDAEAIYHSALKSL